MITVNIIGGLGNQMFQYAFGYAVSKENNTKIRLDLSGFNSYELRYYELGLFNIEENLELKSKYDFFLNRLNGKEKIIMFGDANMKIKKNQPGRRKNFRARHGCDTRPPSKMTARYWSCKKW